MKSAVVYLNIGLGSPSENSRRQRAACESAARSLGAQVTGEFVDMRGARTALHRMTAYARRSAADYVIVASPGDLASEPVEYRALLNRLLATGATFVTSANREN